MLRDGHCAFPACARTRRLKVHHIVSWLDGGPTDINNLLLLCQHHHTLVHEGGNSITVNHAGDAGQDLAHPKWIFRSADNTLIVPEVTGHDLRQALPPLSDPFGKLLTGSARETALARRRELQADHERRRAERARQQAELHASYAHIWSMNDPRAQQTIPIGGGEGFNLANCVDVLVAAHQRATRDRSHQQTTSTAA